MAENAVPEHGSFWARCNLALDERQHGGLTVAYRIRHVSSGKVFIGWLGDCYRGVRIIEERLRQGRFPNAHLQQLVLQDPSCELDVFVPDRKMPEVDIQDVTRSVIETWLQAAAGNVIHNSTPLPPAKPVYEAPRRGRPPAAAKPPKVVKPPKEPKPKPAREPRAVKQAAPKKERHNPHPWKNVRVTSKEHSEVAAFRLRHPASGHVFLGSTKNLAEALHILSMKLRTAECPSPLMQECFDEEPVFELDFQLVGSEIARDQRASEAQRIAGAWLQDAGELGEMVHRAKQALNQHAAVRSTSTSRLSNGEMHQITVKAQDGVAQGPRDFLHEAWFTYQRPETPASY